MKKNYLSFISDNNIVISKTKDLVDLILLLHCDGCLCHNSSLFLLHSDYHTYYDRNYYKYHSRNNASNNSTKRWSVVWGRVKNACVRLRYSPGWTGCVAEIRIQVSIADTGVFVCSIYSSISVLAIGNTAAPLQILVSGLACGWRLTDVVL